MTEGRKKVLTGHVSDNQVFLEIIIIEVKASKPKQLNFTLCHDLFLNICEVILDI